MRYSERYNRMCEIYKASIEDYNLEKFDWSEDAKRIMYEYESKGLHKKILGNTIFFDDTKPNGYFFGKKYMDITIKSWINDGGITEAEMLEIYPKIFVDKLLKIIRKKWARKYYP